MARHTLDGGGEVFGRHVQSLGIVAHVAFCTADTCSEQRHELFHDLGRAVAMGIGGIALCMRLEDVVHHSQTETALTSRAEQVHTGVAQLRRIHRQKVGGKVKIVTLFVKPHSVIFLVALNSPYSHD